MEINFTHYQFAFFVFVLVCIAIVLFKKTKNSSVTDEKVFHEKEKRLFKLYQNIEDMMTSAEEYMEEARESIAKDKQDIEKMLKKVDNLHKDVQLDIEKNQQYIDVKSKEVKRPNTSVHSAETSNSEPTTKNHMSKNELVKYLSEEGLDTEQISKELGISKGEVELIIGLNR